MIPHYARHDGYAKLGLANNPFIAEQQPGVDLHLWIERPDEPELPQPAQRCLVQLIGERGAGKTSLMLHWQAICPGPYSYIPIGPARYCLPSFGPIVYWDELDRMPKILLLISLRYAALRHMTVVAATHHDCCAIAQRCGLQVISHCFLPLTAALLQQWATVRIAAACLPGQRSALQLDPATAQQICERAGASWREAAVLLHIWAAQNT